MNYATNWKNRRARGVRGIASLKITRRDPQLQQEAPPIDPNHSPFERTIVERKLNYGIESVKLSCGHSVTRIITSPNDTKMDCPTCVNEFLATERQPALW